jgi:hypothetical protein
MMIIVLISNHDDNVNNCIDEKDDYDDSDNNL